jgi:hypothetical protein
MTYKWERVQRHTSNSQSGYPEIFREPGSTFSLKIQPVSGYTRQINIWKFEFMKPSFFCPSSNGLQRTWYMLCKETNLDPVQRVGSIKSSYK